MIRQQIGAVASLRNVVIVNRLPKLVQGKILRKLMKHRRRGTVSNPSTIDETIIDEIKVVLIKYEIGTFNKK
jgi:propionyl-CoA synthetase